MVANRLNRTRRRLGLRGRCLSRRSRRPGVVVVAMLLALAVLLVVVVALAAVAGVVEGEP